MHAMRHSEERLTTQVYTDATHLAVARHVSSRPSFLTREKVSAIVSGEIASEGNETPQADTMAIAWNPTEAPENQGFKYSLKQGVTLGHKGENGSGGWDRTKDLVINSN